MILRRNTLTCTLTFTLSILLAAWSVSAQTRPSFEVAVIKPAAQPDVARLTAAMQEGGKMPIGANIQGSRAEYLFLDLKSLLVYAYGVKPYQITGPDWMQQTRFDITAKIPDGSSKSDVPKMLQSLLEERFRLTAHRTSAEHPVLALVVGKDGPKLKASTEKPVAIDESVPLKPGQITMDGPDGPMRMSMDATTGSTVVDMGLKGRMTTRMIPESLTLRMDFTMTTMAGLADMLTQMFGQLGGGTGGRRVIDRTGLDGNYDASIEVSLADLLAVAREAGVLAGGPGGAPGGNLPVAADPGGGGTSLRDAVQSMGLKLESQNAVVEQFIVDHIEKTPTDN